MASFALSASFMGWSSQGFCTFLLFHSLQLHHHRNLHGFGTTSLLENNYLISMRHSANGHSIHIWYSNWSLLFVELQQF